MDAFAPEPTAFAARRASTIPFTSHDPSPSPPHHHEWIGTGSLSMHPRFMTRQYRRRRLARTKGAPAPRRHFPHAKGTSHPHPSCRPPCASSRRPAPVANTRFATWRKLISGARDAPTRSTRFVRFARDGGDDDADDPDIARPWRRSRWGRKMRAWTIARGWDERVDRRCALSELRAIDRARREGRARPRRGAHARWMICLLYTSPSPRDLSTSRMPSSA